MPGVYRPGEQLPAALGVVIYGHGGTGKTTLLGTMPGNGIVLDVPQIEGGTFVLKNHAARIDIKSVNEWKELEDIYWFLAKQKHQYRWYGIDSITAMQQLAIRLVVKERPLSADPSQITQNEWGRIGRLVGEMIYKFRTLNMHGIFVAQLRDKDGERRGPDISPSALSMLLPSMTLIGYLSVQRDNTGEWIRHLKVGPDESYHTKARAYPGVVIPPVVKNPNLGTLLPWLFGMGTAPEAAADGPTFILS